MGAEPAGTQVYSSALNFCLTFSAFILNKFQVVSLLYNHDPLHETL